MPMYSRLTLIGWPIVRIVVGLSKAPTLPEGAVADASWRSWSCEIGGFIYIDLLLSNIVIFQLAAINTLG